MKPQMSQREVSALESILLSYGPHIDVLEWGSGGSTVFFTKFLRENDVTYSWTSIEYNKLWYGRVLDEVKSDSNTTLMLFDVGNTALRQRDIPMNEYVSYPSTLDKKYDFILVDGRKRRRCVLEARTLLKPGGVVILHDAKRTFYHSAFSSFSDSKMILWSGLWRGKIEHPGVLVAYTNKLQYWFFRLYTFMFRFKHLNTLKLALKDAYIGVVNHFKKNETITDAKKKWNTLAKEDANYYVYTNKVVSDSEEKFTSTGENDVNEYFVKDTYLSDVLKENVENSVLEIGCGTGRLSEFISKHTHKLFVVDISEEMISQARERLKGISNIEFFATDGVSFPIDSESVNVVFSLIVFQHMSSLSVVKQNIHEVSRVLKRGGVAKIQLRGKKVSKSNWYYGPSFTDEHEVNDLVEGTSLEIIKCEGWNSRHLWVWFKKK